MDGKKSRFEFDTFYGGGERMSFCVNRGKYTLEEAVKIANEEWPGFLPESPQELGMLVRESAVSYGFGLDEDDNPRNGWWLHPGASAEGKRQVPVWEFLMSC